MDDRRVVVMIRPDVLVNKDTGRFAARYTVFGLTAYGKNNDEAVSKVRRMLEAALYEHRRSGNLEDWLNSSGVEWFWEDEYKGSSWRKVSEPDLVAV